MPYTFAAAAAFGPVCLLTIMACDVCIFLSGSILSDWLDMQIGSGITRARYLLSRFDVGRRRYSHQPTKNDRGEREREREREKVIDPLLPMLLICVASCV